AVVFALAASYALSMLVVPAACARFLKASGRHGAGGHGSAFERGFEAVQQGYTRLLGLTMRYRPLTLAGVAATLGLSLLLLPLLGQELFPQIDSGQFMVLAHAPSGTRMEKTE